jgi:hypothetical protein
VEKKIRSGNGRGEKKKKTAALYQAAHLNLRRDCGCFFLRWAFPSYDDGNLMLSCPVGY